MTCSAVSCPYAISIHSAARAETVRSRPSSYRGIYFNPLRREGGDPCRCYRCIFGTYFNPLRREGGDHKRRRLKSKIQISIHSAARAETAEELETEGEPEISIHSAARAETVGMRFVCGTGGHFNPLRREGGDLVDTLIDNPVSDFNPLRREGGDGERCHRC